MIKMSIALQDLRKRIYVKAKAEKAWRFWGLYVHVCKWETLDTSNNRAKLLLEFSSSIAHEVLKVRYGEGFGGAPLRLPPATHHVTTGAETSSDEQTQAQRTTTVGGDDHV